MDREIFSFGESGERDRRTDRRLEQLWVFGLLLAALLLYGINLDGVPLRDWDEGIVAHVARDIWRGNLNWLHPTLAGEPYFNKPPLVHLLIAIAYSAGGVSELMARLPPATVSAFSVPLLYGVGREVFPRRTPAIFAALIYLTLLPVVRHGRLAMLDGPVLCFSLLMLWCLLRSRRDLRFGLGAGIGLGLVCLTKGVLGLLLGAIAAVFIAWDTPRLLRSWYLWAGLLLGAVPAAAWYAAQWQHYGQQFIQEHFFSQSLQRLWLPVGNNAGPPWYYLLEIVKYSGPWLLFWPQGLRLAWENRNLGFGKLVLVWGGLYLLAISVMRTKLPWYVLPVYPALALAGGALLAEVWGRRARAFPTFSYSVSFPLYPSRRAWVAAFALLAVAGLAGSLYFGGLGPQTERYLQLALGCAALTMAAVAVLVSREDPQFILVLFWGCYVSLTLFVSSNSWVWELAEDYPVLPVAAMVQQHAPAGVPVRTSHPYSRPSLNFYSDRQVIPAPDSELQRHWQQDSQPYLLLDRPALEKLGLQKVKPLATADGWMLLARNKLQSSSRLH
ncbi:ArnT family glycosyltransferase [Kamptonema formosum]|uniref:ArnT family glycosyltransferase n=1 Tax=Kamptonema formosum TaxID=331992 RepID=UPI000378786F|nr:glycosyltransferase family 39 protein [Oscillatoria sp. PCC 10802]